jgi:hypothetical protein
LPAGQISGGLQIGQDCCGPTADIFNISLRPNGRDGLNRERPCLRVCVNTHVAGGGRDFPGPLPGLQLGTLLLADGRRVGAMPHKIDQQLNGSFQSSPGIVVWVLYVITQYRQVVHHTQVWLLVLPKKEFVEMLLTAYAV